MKCDYLGGGKFGSPRYVPFGLSMVSVGVASPSEPGTGKKLSFGHTESASVMNMIAASDDFVLGLCNEEESIHCFDPTLKKFKIVSFANIVGGHTDTIRCIVAMGASEKLAFFLAEVGDAKPADENECGNAKPAAKKMKTTPATADSTE